MANTELLTKHGKGTGNERITDLSMSLENIIFELSEGNPGAMTVLMNVITKDPMNMMKLLTLDTFGVFGSNIWCLYKDEAKQDIDTFIGYL